MNDPEVTTELLKAIHDQIQDANPEDAGTCWFEFIEGVMTTARQHNLPLCSSVVRSVAARFDLEV